MSSIVRAEWEKPFSLRQAIEDVQARANDEESTITIADIEKLFSDLPQLQEQYALFMYDPPGHIPEDKTAYKYYIVCESWLTPGSDHYHIHYRFREKIGQRPYSVTVQVPCHEVAASNLNIVTYRCLGQFAIPAWYKEMQWELPTQITS